MLCAVTPGDSGGAAWPRRSRRRSPQVLNQTSRIELQLRENSLSTTKLEKQLLLQTNEIHKLQNRNK